MHRVTTPLTRRAAAFALMALFAVAACGTSASPSTSVGAPSTAPLSGTVDIDGSSTVFPITEIVAEEFIAVNPGVRVPVAFSGTGGGFQKFCRGEKDINDASRPIKEDDEAEGVACEANGVEWIELQIAIDGLTVTVNPDNDFVTCLTVAELATIYGPDSPQNLTWNQVNPAFPNQPVVRFMPGADSGTFDYFTEEINGEADVSTSHATQSEDDNQLVQGVAGDVNAIGYFGYAYYAENQDSLKAVEVDGGAGCVGPTETTINDGTYTPLSRPLFIYPDVAKAKVRPELKAFVDFYLETSQTLSAEVKYIPVPDDLAAAEKTEWEAAAGG
jgi:phosphate transport system substrate-binding protein